MNQAQLSQALRDAVALSNRPFPLTQQNGFVSLPDSGTFDQLVGHLCYQVRAAKLRAHQLEEKLNDEMGG